MDFTRSSRPASFTVVRPRATHLVDAENLLGSPRFSSVDACEIRRAYGEVAPAGPFDMTIIATSHFAAAQTWMAWPGSARRLIRSGPDGADLAILRVIEAESLHLRFDRIVIGSGDGIFALAAATLQRLGCQVTVFSRRDGLSRQLRLAVRDVRFIDEPLATAELQLALGQAA